MSYSLTVYEKIFIVKYFYKLDEDLNSVWEAFKKHFPTDIPVSVYQLIPQIISTFEVTGSVLSDFYYQKPSIQSPIIHSVKIVKGEICYLNDQAVHEETVIAEDQDGETKIEGQDEEELIEDEQSMEPETQLIVEGEGTADEDDSDDEDGEIVEEEEDMDDMDVGEEELEEDDSGDESDSDEDYEVRPTPKKTQKRAGTHSGTPGSAPGQHMINRRVRGKSGGDTSGRKKSRSPRKPPQKKFCEICQKYVGACFAEHLATHSKTRDFVCKTCSKAFTTIRYLREHEFTHSEGTFVCEICGKPSKTKSNHNSHMRVHSEKKYPCDQCPLTFKRAQGLTRHKLTHSGEKPFKCRQCGQEFAQHMTRQMHERLHTGERPYKCHHCNKSFIGAPALNVSEKEFILFHYRLILFYSPPLISDSFEATRRRVSIGVHLLSEAVQGG